jgi:hypothetical protein
VRTWDILVPTFYARTPLFLGLLDQLAAQMRPGVRVIAARGDRDPERIHEKQQALLDASDADYVCICADDALLHPEYVSLLHDAMQTGPDVIGFKLQCSHWPEPQHHSIAFHGIPELAWAPNRPDLFWGPRGGVRWCDLGTWMPIKRSIGSRVRFEMLHGDCDDTWTRGVMATGLVRHEVYFNEVLVRPQVVDPGFHGQWEVVDATPHPERPFVKYI